jgi:hypothetical protein
MRNLRVRKPSKKMPQGKSKTGKTEESIGREEVALEGTDIINNRGESYLACKEVEGTSSI